MKPSKGKSERKTKEVKKLAGIKLKATALQRVTLQRVVTSDQTQ
jgi:hypothetical protein